jgi:Xaa-Pro dipeptidase
MEGNPLSDYQSRREKIYNWMSSGGTDLLMISDFEEHRNPLIRWLSGQPGDALLFLSAAGHSLLVPWDINMATLYAKADAIVPYKEFERQPVKALKGVIERLKIPKGTKVEIPGTTPYPRFSNYVKEIPGFEIICREGGVWTELEKIRAVKDEGELKIYRSLSELTSSVINQLEDQVRAGKIKTEAEAALFIDFEGRKQGCEGTGFETLAAGPSRSFGIHAFPPYTGQAFGSPGLSILDFGLKYSGYTSDVTMTFAKGPLSDVQEEMLSLTEEAYKLALGMAKPGASTRDIAIAVDKFFAKSEKSMPHGLGHGIGLLAHEAPFLSIREDSQWILEKNMIITIEPGLYDPVHGGCRLENDILITETGAELLTNSRVVRL